MTDTRKNDLEEIDQEIVDAEKARDKIGRDFEAFKLKTQAMIDELMEEAGIKEQVDALNTAISTRLEKDQKKIGEANQEVYGLTQAKQFLVRRIAKADAENSSDEEVLDGEVLDDDEQEEKPARKKRPSRRKRAAS